jgi:hypothetical protein
MCSGLKVAIVGSSHLSEVELNHREYSTAIHSTLHYYHHSNGVQKFLLGRQLIVVPLNFLIANITLFRGYETLHPVVYFLLVGLALPGNAIHFSLCLKDCTCSIEYSITFSS